MPIEKESTVSLSIQNDRAFIGVSFDLKAFPSMLETHAESFPKTKALEDHYTFLKHRKFSNFDELSQFVKSVCKWGNYAGVSGKVLKNNAPEKIVSVFEQIHDILYTGEPDLSKALSVINTLYGLGTPSFASKHLRFMAPEICPVYDSILTNALPYRFDSAGYAAFAKDCSKVSEALVANNIPNPIRESPKWYVSDVEAAIFSQYY